MGPGMSDDPEHNAIPLQPQNATKKSVGDVLAQRMEALAPEVRAIGTTNA